MQDSLTMSEKGWPRWLSFAFGLGMAVFSVLTIEHYYAANYPTSIFEGSFCDISAFFNCDSSAYSEISAIGGVPLGFFGLFLGVLVALGAVFPSAAFERTNKTLSLLNAIGVVTLLLYSVFGLGSLCLLCSGFYVFSLASFLLFWKYGIDKDKGSPAGWFNPSIKHLVTYGAVALAGAWGFTLYTEARHEAQSGGVAARAVKQFYNPIVLAIVILNFLLLQLAEGDAVDVLAGEAGSATPEYMAELRAKFGLDQPLPVQLAVYLKNVMFFDLGYSFRHEMPVSELILDRMMPTLLLMVATITLAVGFGILLGLVAAMGLNTWRDTAISIFALITYATPLFWVGLMMIVVFSLNLRWFPTSGMENFAMFYEGWDRVWDIAHHLVLPTITLSLFYLALYTRLMRASMLEQAGQDYVTTARAKGVTENRIMFVHVLRNALLPVVTMAGVQVGALIGGSVIVESVFAWPGLGMLAFEALFSRDLNLLLGIFLLSALLVVAVNLVVDIIYSTLDPRIEVS